MRNLCVLWAVLTVISSCSLFKASKKTTSKTHQTTNDLTKFDGTIQTNTITKSTQISYKKDSARMGYTIQFWPKGKLEFSLTNGFSGDFDSVVLKGNLMEIGRSAQVMASTGQQKSTVKAAIIDSQQSVSDRAKTIKQSSFQWKVVLAAVLIVIFLLFYWFRR